MNPVSSSKPGKESEATEWISNSDGESEEGRRGRRKRERKKEEEEEEEEQEEEEEEVQLTRPSTGPSEQLSEAGSRSSPTERPLNHQTWRISRISSVRKPNQPNRNRAQDTHQSSVHMSVEPRARPNSNQSNAS